MSTVQGANRKEQWLQSHDLPELRSRLVLDMRAQVWWWWVPYALRLVEHFRLPRHADARQLSALELLRTVWPSLGVVPLQTLVGGVSGTSSSPGAGGDHCVSAWIGNIMSIRLLLRLLPT